jgi:hypothetical protein
MANLLETVEGIALNPDLLSTLQTDMSGLAGRASGLPDGAIQNIVNLTGQITLPDQQGLFGSSATQLSTLVDTGLGSPDDLWSALTNPLSNLEGSITNGIESPITEVFSSIGDIANLSASDPASLLMALSEPLQQIASILGENAEIQRIREFIAKIQDIESQISAAPDQLATLLTDQIQAAIEEATQLVSPVFQQLEGFIDYLESRAQLTGLQEDYDAILLKLLPTESDSIATAIESLDFSSDIDFAALDGSLRTSFAMLQNFSKETEIRLEGAVELLPEFNTDAWIQRVTSAANTASASELNSLESLLATWRETLIQAQDVISGLSLDNILEPLAQFSEQIQPALQGLDLASVEAQLTQGLQTSTNVVETVSQAQIDMLARFQGISNSIVQTIDAVNLDAVTVSIDNSISAIDPVLTQIEGSIDDVSTEVQASLDSINGELQTLQSKLTDPAGEYRAPIEDFLNSINDAIPDNIPAELENIGQQLADAISGLENIALDPVFDSVVEQLENMRAELQAVDAGSLSPILQAALSTALAVFKSFDYESEVEGFLTDKFDTAVAVVDEEAIQLLQDQIDGILVHVRSYNPSMLFDTLGITQVYDDMVSDINNFRPSDGLADIVDTLNSAMDELEAMTPGKILQPIVEPLDQLKTQVNALSLDPVFIQIQQALDALKALLTRLDISAFVADITGAIDQLKLQLQALLTVEGLLEPLQPIHQAVMDAVTTVDPSVLLQPLTDVQQALLGAIDSVDETALTNSINTIASTIDSFSLPQVKANLQGKTQALADSVDSLDLPAKFNELRSIQQSVKTAIEARGEQADADTESRRQALLGTINAMDPLPLMATSLVQFREFQNGTMALATELDSQMSEGGGLEQPLESLSDRLREIGPDIEEGIDDVKQALRDIVNQALEASGVDQINEIYTELQNTLASYAPSNLEAAIDELIAPFTDAIDELVDPSEVFDEVLTAFDNLKSLIDPGLDDFLVQLRDQLEPILEAITSKVESLDPGIIIGPLDAKYADIIAIKDQLQAKIQALLDSLDAPYETVVQTIEALNPAQVLAEPLDATYQLILNKVDGIDIHVVFEPLFEALRALLDQLIAGIKRTGDAFELFLNAAPSGSDGASVSI